MTGVNTPGTGPTGPDFNYDDMDVPPPPPPLDFDGDVPPPPPPLLLSEYNALASRTTTTEPQTASPQPGKLETTLGKQKNILTNAGAKPAITTQLFQSILAKCQKDVSTHQTQANTLPRLTDKEKITHKAQSDLTSKCVTDNDKILKELADPKISSNNKSLISIQLGSNVLTLKEEAKTLAELSKKGKDPDTPYTMVLQLATQAEALSMPYFQLDDKEEQTWELLKSYKPERNETKGSEESSANEGRTKELSKKMAPVMSPEGIGRCATTIAKQLMKYQFEEFKDPNTILEIDSALKALKSATMPNSSKSLLQTMTELKTSDPSKKEAYPVGGDLKKLIIRFQGEINRLSGFQKVDY